MARVMRKRQSTLEEAMPHGPKRRKESSKLEPEAWPWQDQAATSSSSASNAASVSPTPDEHEPDEPESPEFCSSVPFIVIFMSKFPQLFHGVPSMGPQDIERGVTHPGVLGPLVEQLLCRLLTLVLNRKKPVEPGRYISSLEQVSHQLQNLGVSPNWPARIRYKSRDALNDLRWQDRLEVLKMLVVWSLMSSDAVRQIVQDQSNAPVLAVEPIGRDQDLNRYYLVQGGTSSGETDFRLYRISKYRLHARVWHPIAADFDQLQTVIDELAAVDDSINGRKLVAVLIEQRQLIIEGIQRRSRAEQKEIKKQRDVQQVEMARKGEGAYTGRTRGRRINYNVEAMEERVLEDNSDTDAFELDDDESVPVSSGWRKSRRLRGMDETEDSPQVLVTLKYGKRENGVSEVAPLSALSLQNGAHALPVTKHELEANGGPEFQDYGDVGVVAEPSESPPNLDSGTFQTPYQAIQAARAEPRQPLPFQPVSTPIESPKAPIVAASNDSASLAAETTVGAPSAPAPITPTSPAASTAPTAHTPTAPTNSHTSD